MESEKHLKLKEKAKDILLRMGFKEDEIMFEYVLPLENGKHFRVDVIGIKKDKRVVIECGTINRKGKAKKLKQIVDEFIYLAYEREEGILKPITLEIEKEVWEQFKERIPRSITLNDKVVELIKQFLQEK